MYMKLKKLIRRVFQKIDGQRIAGLNTSGDGEWVYFLPHPDVDARKQFRTLVSQASKPQAKSGAIGEAGTSVVLPDGRTFHGIYYRGDIQGWRAKVTDSCQRQGILLARFKRRRFIVDGEQPYRIRDLKIETL